jgi:hypothetical protein
MISTANPRSMLKIVSRSIAGSPWTALFSANVYQAAGDQYITDHEC